MPSPFFTGRTTFARFLVDGPLPTFGPEHLEKLDTNAIGKQKIATADGSQFGWTAGEHLLDTQFDLAKNVVNDTLNFGLRADEQKPPAALLKAYTAQHVKELAAGNPSGFPSARQKREAKELAKERLEEEARDGRFLRRTVTPILWDRDGNELLIASTSGTAIDRVHALFYQTFGCKFQMLDAARRAALTYKLDGIAPSPFRGDTKDADVRWAVDAEFLGNEFLLWLWYWLENVSDTLKLDDDSEVTAMLTRTLALDCPRGQTGKDVITGDGPSKQPEALRAIQAGKLPRKAGMVLVRQDQQYELTLHAETFVIASAKLPACESEDARARLEERVTQLRHLRETVDLMYQTFCARRLGGDWERELAKMKLWLHMSAKAA